MAGIYFTGADETFEFEWNDGSGLVGGVITSVNVSFVRYTNSTKEFLQSDKTTFSTTATSFTATLVANTSSSVWQFPLVVPQSMLGYNVELTASPITTGFGIRPISTDFYVNLAVDDLTISQYRRQEAEALRNFTSGVGYVRGTNFTVTGTKSTGIGGFSVTYNGSTYTPGDGFLVDGGTTWTLTAPVGVETAAGSPNTLSVKKTGSLTKSVSIIVDRTAPTVSLALTGMTVGTSAGSPMIRGEYVRYVPTYSDSNSGFDTGSFSYTTAGDFTAAAPALTASGTAVAYQRTSATAPTTGSTTVNVTVFDRAGNSASASVQVFFTSVPAAPTVSGTVTSTNQSPLTLFTGVELTEAPTPYTNASVTANVSVNTSMPRCRNSNTDDTRLGLQSGTLTLTAANVVGNQATTQSVTASVPSNASALARTITPNYVTQYHQTGTGTAFGSFDYNANKSIDINSEPSLVTPSGGFNSVNAETLYDAYVPTQVSHRGVVSKEANISIIGGQGTTASTTTGNRFVVRIPIPTNNATNQVYRITVRGPAGQLSASDGVAVEYAPNGGTNYTSANLSQQFTSTAGATSMDVRVTMTSTAVNSRINAVYVEFIQ